ncbi:MAG TPA: LysR substrate-binding domain-containing protein [Polyangiales bacterium]|nr:LysR substrate-binding domain-containing protein [Polyangiales bacterium]
MDRLEAMQVFVSVAEQQSFISAARRHSLSAARVTRAVAALEKRLGARLLHRTTRAVRLTDVGASYLAQCKRILSEIDAAEVSAAKSHRELSGPISITAPRLFGRLHVSPIITGFMKRHPRVTLRALFADQVLDFFEQNLDVAIRIAQLPDSNLRAVRVGSVRRVVCASPEYLRTHGTPRHPREVTQHSVIGFSGQAEPEAWTFAIDGRHERVVTRPRLIVNTADLAVAAALAGQGLTKVLSYQVARQVEQRKLRIVLAEYELPAVPVHVVHMEVREPSARVRAFVDYAVSQLRASL